MRRLSLCLVALLSGCSIVFMAPYDSVEYEHIVNIRTMAQQHDCSDSAVEKLWYETQTLRNFSEYLPDNAPQIALNKDLATVVGELYRDPDRSAMYCRFKLEHIESMAERIQKATGAKPR